MPKGVICGGAVEGSNQLGAIVTCQAMVACPAGAGWAKVAARRPATTAATSVTVRSNEPVGSVMTYLLAIGSRAG